MEPSPFDIVVPQRTVAALELNACAVRRGELYCWGSPALLGHSWGAGDFLGPERLHLPPVDKVVLAESYSLGLGCVLASNGRVWCWGHGRYGAVGNGECGASGWLAAPAALPAPAEDIAASGEVACALLTDRRVACWGGTPVRVLRPGACPPNIVVRPDGTPLRVDRLEAGAGIDERLQVYTWLPPLAEDRREGAGAVRDHRPPSRLLSARHDELYPAIDVGVAVMGRATRMAAPVVCALSPAGAVRCIGGSFESGEAVRIRGLPPARRVVCGSVGSRWMCVAVTRAGALYQWGEFSAFTWLTGSVGVRRPDPYLATLVLKAEPESLSVTFHGGCMQEQEAVLCWGRPLNGFVDRVAWWPTRAL